MTDDQTACKRLQEAHAEACIAVLLRDAARLRAAIDEARQALQILAMSEIAHGENTR